MMALYHHKRLSGTASLMVYVRTTTQLSAQLLQAGHLARPALHC